MSDIHLPPDRNPLAEDRLPLAKMSRHSRRHLPQSVVSRRDICLRFNHSTSHNWLKCRARYWGGILKRGGGNYFHQKQLYADVIQAGLMLRYNKRSRMKV